jgi:hypothetical protein
VLASLAPTLRTGGSKVRAPMALLTPPGWLLKNAFCKSENRGKGIKDDYLFYTRYGGKFNRYKDNSINYIFNCLCCIDENNPVWKSFSPQNIRNWLIRKLFYNHYSIEEISYLTGMDLINIAKLITDDDIVKRVELTKKSHKKLHPFHKYFE